MNVTRLSILLIGVLIAGCTDNGSGFEYLEPDDGGTTDGDTDCDTDSDSDTDSDGDSDTESTSDTETESETETDTETGLDTESDTDTDSDSESDSETETESDTETESETEVEPDCTGPDTYLMDWAPGEYRCWENDPPTTMMAYADAVARCEALVLDGHDDWYLPNITELQVLITGCSGTFGCPVHDPTCLYESCADTCTICALDAGPGTDGCYWPVGLGGECNTFWSSSERIGEPGDARWAVHFRSSTRMTADVMNPTKVSRCIRTL